MKNSRAKERDLLTITELLEPTPSPLWRIVKQAGVDQVVSLLDGAEQQWRWPKRGLSTWCRAGTLPHPKANAPGSGRR